MSPALTMEAESDHFSPYRSDGKLYGFVCVVTGAEKAIGSAVVAELAGKYTKRRLRRRLICSSSWCGSSICLSRIFLNTRFPRSEEITSKHKDYWISIHYLEWAGYTHADRRGIECIWKSWRLGLLIRTARSCVDRSDNTPWSTKMLWG